MENKKKIINDPVHGFIPIPNSLIYDLIQHPYFQRLPAAEGIDRVLLRKFPVQQRHGQRRTPDGAQTVSKTRQHDQHLFSGAEADIVHGGAVHLQLSVFKKVFHAAPAFLLFHQCSTLWRALQREAENNAV